ncbi:MAG: hypothetical protein ACRDK9_15025 [Solirubrobacterales bacterium]
MTIFVYTCPRACSYGVARKHRRPRRTPRCYRCGVEMEERRLYTATKLPLAGEAR